MHALLAEADVFSQGYRLGTLARRGLGPEAVAELRPGIVYVSENCYGHVGPWRERPGWEQLGQAATGMSMPGGDVVPVGRAAPRAGRGQRLHDRVPRRLRRDGGAGPPGRRGRVVARPGVAVPDLHVVPAARGRQRHRTGGPGRHRSRSSPRWTARHFGRIAYLAPALSMSKTPPHWDLPPAPSGAHEPVWLPR